jgi:hypothetical protein
VDGGARKGPGRRRDHERIGVLIGGLALVLAALSAFTDLFGSPLLQWGSEAGSGRATQPASVVTRATVEPVTVGAATTGPSSGQRLLSSLGDLPGEFDFDDAGVLRLQCPTGRAGDTERSATVSLPGAYRSLVATVRGAGRADPETGVQLEVLAGYRQDLADRLELRGRVVTTLQAPPRSVTVRLDGAPRLALQWHCTDRDAVIELVEPRLVR